MSAVLRKDRMVDRALIEIVNTMFLDFEQNLPTLFKAMGRNELKSHEDKIEEFVAEAKENGRTLSEIAEFTNKDLSVQEMMALIDSLVLRKRMKYNEQISAYVSTASIFKCTSKNLFDLILKYKPSTPEDVIKKAQPIELDRLCSKEVQQLIKENTMRAENAKQGKLWNRKSM